MMKLKESDLQYSSPPSMYAFNLPMGGKYAAAQDEETKSLFTLLNQFVQEHPMTAYELARALDYYKALIGANALVQPIPSWEEAKKQVADGTAT